ncbi:hypothetical protein GCM10027275_42330 [Rhabdobacter roseus]|uniref:DUF4932 domain-containing protein n=1 Tax=Rhabdobacter roseus TaxID=1655419 RepID=A0A840TX74_9BACT|nr:DUF4932 domain-containing protein [Rhabdobacter roseus]MBB5286212.1 hypothetical protein [Rhabdobacter roseus]
MKKILLLLLVGQISFCRANGAPSNEKLRIAMNKNVELLGLGYFIGFEGVDIETKTVEINGQQVPKKERHAYGYYLYQKYKSFASSKNLEKSFTVADHLWLDYLINLLLQVEDFPNARLTDSIEERYFINFSQKKDPREAKELAVLFLEGLNEFYKEIDFDKYLAEHQVYYAQSLAEVAKTLPKNDFIGTMEAFYKTSFARYTLVPSLTIPKGMGFGLRYTSGGGTNVFNVFGAFDRQYFQRPNEVVMGFENEQRLRELSVHEFGHSFVNPVVDQLPAELFLKTEKRFEPLKSAMSDQGYITWKACVYEHFVRAGEIIISEKLGDDEGAKTLQAYYENGRKFRYLPVLLVELRKFDEGTHKTYYEAVVQAMEALAKN